MSLDFTKVNYVDGSTIIEADNLNDIQDAILALDSNKVEAESGKGLSTEDYTSAEKSKLSGIQAGAQVNPGNATTSADGLMSSVDKAKLDGIASGATAVTIDNTLSIAGRAADAKATGDALAVKYEKPSSGIPKTDLASDVQTSLGKADTALQEHQSLSAYRTAAAQDVIDNAQDDDIAEINAKIPAAASSVNKLMDAAAVNAAIASAVAGITGFSYEIVQALPASGEAGVIYLLSNSGSTPNIYDEYIWIGTGFEKIGTTEVDLSQYRTSAAQDVIDAGKLSTDGDGSNVTAAFTAASTRANLTTGEKLSVLFGKIAKWFADLGTAAFRAATNAITQGSTDLIESGAVYTGLAAKQGTINASGILKGDGNGGVSAATPGTDYLAPGALTPYRTAAAQDMIDAGKQAKIAASGLLKGDGNGGVTSATAGTDYQAPLIAGTDYETPAGAKALGLTGASAGDLVRINTVDANGRPTSWKRVALNEIKCNKNWLHNWYFVGGGSQQGGEQFPINQRGQTVYSGAGYGIDRWSAEPSFSITQAGILFQNVLSWIEQRFQIGSVFINQYTYTASALLSDGSLHYGSITCDTSLASQKFFEDEYIASFAVYSGGTYHDIGFGTRQTNVTIVATKLELGSGQTLAHNEGTEENPVWVLNEIPNFSDELARCKYYFERLSGKYAIFASGIAVGSTSARLIGKVSPKRATTSNITLNGTIYIAQPGAEGPSGKAATAISSQSCQPSGSLFMAVSSVTGLTGSVPCWFQFRDTTSHLDISADL